MVQHSLPALQLHPSFFKTRLTKVDLRNFHRPKIHFSLNAQFTFSKIRTFKKKKGKKAKDDLMSSCKDLTLKDNTNIVLIEYSVIYYSILKYIFTNFFKGAIPSNPV
jgi:transcription initiation factor TFIID subunit 1